MAPPMLQAHRGVSIEFPENTMSAFIGARDQGYPIIEVDPAVTKDGQIVLFHDCTMTRTVRTKDGKQLEQEMSISDLTYTQAQEYDYGLWFSEEFKGEKIPLLSEVLAFAADNHIHIKIDNKIQRFTDEALEKTFKIVRESGADVGITCFDMKFVRRVLKAIPNVTIHYDGKIQREIMEELSQMLPKAKLVVWVPYQCSLTTWVQIDFADEAICNLVKKYARLGIWILATNEEYEDVAARFEPDIIETTGGIKPRK